MKPRLRRDCVLPKHVAHHHGTFFWRNEHIGLMVRDTIDPADLEAVAAEIRALRARDAARKDQPR